MAARFNLISDIRPGKIDYKFKLRLLHSWKVPEYQNPSVIQSLDLLLLDEKSSKIHATITKSHMAVFESQLNDGSCYIIQNLLVIKNDPKFRVTDHKYKLRFIATTKCILTQSPAIPKNYFNFVDFSTILGGLDETNLIDVIGHVVKKSDLKETEKNNKLLDIVLEDLVGNKLECTLWEEYARELEDYLREHGTEGSVILILQLCRSRIFNSQLGIANAYATKLFINADFKEVDEYKEKLESGNANLTQTVSYVSDQNTISLADDLLASQYMTIEDIVDATEKCECVVLARVIEIESGRGWSFESCPKCACQVKKMNRQYYCETCAMMVKAVIRYKLPLQVMDSTGSVTFVLFDRVLEKYVGMSAQAMVNAVAKGKEDAILPKGMESLLDKVLLFKVAVSNANISRHWQSFAVRRMSDDADLITQFMKKWNIKDTQDIDSNDVVSAEVADNIKCDINNQSPMKKLEHTQQESSVANVVGKQPVEEEGLEKTPSAKVTRKMIVDDDGDDETPPTSGLGKRIAAEFDTPLDRVEHQTKASATKGSKVVQVNKERTEVMVEEEGLEKTPSVGITRKMIVDDDIDDKTPPTRGLGKRIAAEFDTPLDRVDLQTKASATKGSKVVQVKKERTE